MHRETGRFRGLELSDTSVSLLDQHFRASSGPSSRSESSSDPKRSPSFVGAGGRTEGDGGWREVDVGQRGTGSGGGGRGTEGHGEWRRWTRDRGVRGVEEGRPLESQDLRLTGVQ